jgi:hypothetical protein
LRKISAFEAHSQAQDVPRFVDAFPADGDDCRRLSMSACTWLGTAMARAFSADSRIVRSPSGLSSRTTSPVSVTHEVVRSPANSVSTRKAGIGAVPAPRTSSRLPTSTIIGALCSVAASKIVQRCLAPVTRPPFASRREIFSDKAGGSGSSRFSVRVLPPVVTASERRVPFTCPRISIGPVPGSSENSNDRS